MTICLAINYKINKYNYVINCMLKFDLEFVY